MLLYGVHEENRCAHESKQRNEQETDHPPVDSVGFWVHKKFPQHQASCKQDRTRRRGGREGPNVDHQTLTHDCPVPCSNWLAQYRFPQMWNCSRLLTFSSSENFLLFVRDPDLPICTVAHPSHSRLQPEQVGYL